jgi:hypothetical protein
MNKKSRKPLTHAFRGSRFEDHVGLRSRADLPDLTERQILKWAKEHRKRTGKWPQQRSGVILSASAEKWCGIDHALLNGRRGLPGRSSLRQLLELHFGLMKLRNYSTLTVRQILAWAKAHRRRSGEWPSRESGAIEGTNGETWIRIDRALKIGGRGLSERSSLIKLLRPVPRLTLDMILGWVSNHRERTGEWPAANSGRIHEAGDETWARIDSTLRTGGRGLQGRSSLSRVLREHFRVKEYLTVEQVLSWIRAHHDRTGDWPRTTSGVIEDAHDQTWGRIDGLLRHGGRGLPRDYSLPRLLKEHFGVTHRVGRPCKIVSNEDQPEV